MRHKKIIISNSKFYEVIQLDDIVYCKAGGSYSEIVLKDYRKIIVSKNLHWLEERCSPVFFFRTHKSYLINMLFVCRVYHHDNIVHLCKGVQIPLSQNKKKQFRIKLDQING